MNSILSQFIQFHNADIYFSKNSQFQNVELYFSKNIFEYNPYRIGNQSGKASEPI
jgi:hypothetical protein